MDARISDIAARVEALREPAYAALSESWRLRHALATRKAGAEAQERLVALLADVRRLEGAAALLRPELDAIVASFKRRTPAAHKARVRMITNALAAIGGYADAME